MARRGGKASSRRSRQRQAQRAQRPIPGAPPRQPVSAPPEATPADETELPAAAADAFDKADAEVRAQASSRAPLTAAARAKRGPTPRFGVAGPSRLTERAAAEYHYVTRDLRNIGVLVIIMAALLAVATIVVNMLGIGQG